MMGSRCRCSDALDRCSALRHPICAKFSSNYLTSVQLTSLMPAPTPPSNPLVRKSASPSASSSASAPKIPRPAHQFSWSRPFAFALRPKMLFLVVAPTAMLLNYLDPLGTNEKVKEKIESVIPTMESAGAAAEARENGGKERVLSVKQQKAIQANMERNLELQKAQGGAATTGGLSERSGGSIPPVEAAPTEAKPVDLATSQESTPSTGSKWGWNAWFGKDPSTPLHHQPPVSPLPPTPPPAAQTTPSEGKTALDGLL